MLKLKRNLLCCILVVLLLLTTAFATSCKNDEPQVEKVTVTFMVDGTQYETQEVTKNTRVTAPTQPTFADADKEFTGWYTDSAFTTVWDFATGIASDNMTLYAGYRTVSIVPSALAMADEAVTSKLVWTQREMSNSSNYVITITNVKTNAVTTLTGTCTFDSTNYTVTFTPSTVPQGGLYNVSLRETGNTAQTSALTASEVLFCGAGSETNPYLIGSELDFTAISQNNVANGVHFALYRNITISPFRGSQSGFTFNGELLGNGRTITLENANCGAISKIGSTGRVYNLNITGTVATTVDSVGALADYNEGTIEKVSSTVAVDSSAGLVGSVNIETTLNTAATDGERGIAGCIVGTNETTGKVINCKVISEDSTTGRIMAYIGGGLFVGYNKGLISGCTSNGKVGGANTILSSKSLSSYSYSGGIAGINAGTITQCLMEEGSTALAQRYINAADVVTGTNNSNIGGIVGYNMTGATVSECIFSGVRVHADENVGGIAGLNNGTIVSCGFEGTYNTNSSRNMLGYVGGRTNVGGIAGAGNGTVDKCFVTGNVFGFTTGTAYSVAPTSTNCVYLGTNPNATTNSVASDYANTAAGFVEEGNIATLTNPSGATNVDIAETFDGTVSVSLADTYLTTLGNKFYSNGTTLRLEFEKNIIPEDTISVVLYNDGVEWSTIEVAETPASIEGPYQRGSMLSGWSYTENGEIEITAEQKVSLYDLQDYADADGVVHLYAHFTARPAATGLKVAVYTRYVPSADLTAVKAGFAALIGDRYEVTYIEFGDSTLTVANFGAAVNEAGDFDIIIGSGTNIATTGGVAILSRAAIDAANTNFSADFLGRQAALLTDSTYAMEFYAYITGQESNEAEVTITVGQVSKTSQLNSLLTNEALVPAVTVADGYRFAGWATTANATTAVVTGTSIEYEDVASLLDADGKVTLYPVFREIVVLNITDTVLDVAVWTKDGDWVTETELDAIKVGFNAYLLDGSVDPSTLTITWNIITTSGNRVADLGAATNVLTSLDIVIGCGANITSTGGVATLSIGDVSASYIAAGRKAALVTDNSLAVELYVYLTETVSADAEITLVGNETKVSTVNNILGTSATLPATTAATGYEFKGWATTQNATEAEITATEIKYSTVASLLVDGKVTLYAVYAAVTPVAPTADTTLHVAVWAKAGSWITDAELAAIKTAFNTYLTENEVDPTTVTIEWHSVATDGNAVADLGAATNTLITAETCDIIIGCGNNVNTTGGVTVIEKATIKATIVAAGRMAAKITDNTLAALLYTYLVG